MTENVVADEVPKELSGELKSLKSVIDSLLSDLVRGHGNHDERRKVEEWMKALADKYPEFGIDSGLRKYYVAEADRLRTEFEKASDLAERLSIGRSVEIYLEKAAEIDAKA